MATLADINNNPLNIRYNPANRWQGQTGENKGFCVFKSKAYGFRAGYRLLVNYLKNGHDTIEKIVGRFAPSHENNTENYIRFVEDDCIIDRKQNLGYESIHDYWTLIMILRAMARMESGTFYDEQQINLFINYPERY